MIEIAVAAAAALAIQNPQQWYIAGTTDRGIFAVDAANIRQVGDKKRFWFLSAIDPTPFDANRVHSLVFAEMDCDDESMRMLQQNSYIDGTLTPTTFNRETTYIAPGTMAQFYFNIVCQDERPGVPSPDVDTFVDQATEILLLR